MQRIEYPKGSKVTIYDGVILIEPTEKWEPKEGEIVRIHVDKYVSIGFYTSRRSDNATTGINGSGHLRIKELSIPPKSTFSIASQDDENYLLTALYNAGYQYNEETHEVEKMRWKPDFNDTYWSFNSIRVFEDINDSTSSDIERINNGLVFKTKQEAQEFFDQVKELAKKR